MAQTGRTPGGPASAGGCWNTVEAISDLSVGDVRRVFRRYVPVAAVVFAVALMGLTLPGPKILGGVGRALPTFSSSAGAGSSSSAVVAAEDSAVAEVAAATPANVTSSFSNAPASSAGFADAPAAPVRLPFPTATAADRGDEPSRAPTTFEAPPPEDSSSSAAAAPLPLQIVGSAWATATAGTPLAAQGVPAKSLPVGTRVGQHDKRSYVRLSGSAPALTLAPHPDAAGQRAPETGMILACQVTVAGWKDAEALRFADAPAHDSTKCVPGVRSADGSWTFDLSAFPTRSDDRGFALVPGPTAPLDFQVAFKAG